MHTKNIQSAHLDSAILRFNVDCLQLRTLGMTEINVDELHSHLTCVIDYLKMKYKKPLQLFCDNKPTIFHG